MGVQIPLEEEQKQMKEEEMEEKGKEYADVIVTFASSGAIIAFKTLNVIFQSAFK